MKNLNILLLRAGPVDLQNLGLHAIQNLLQNGIELAVELIIADLAAEAVVEGPHCAYLGFLEI